VRFGFGGFLVASRIGVMLAVAVVDVDAPR
jgi:hypothetical protein